MALHQNITSSCIISGNSVFKNGSLLISDTCADLNSFLLAVYQHLELNYPKFYKMDNLSKLGWLASEVLLKNSFEREQYQAQQIGLVLSNANSSLDADIKYWDSAQEFASPSLFVYTLPNIVIGEICIRNDFKGENAFYITETFDAAFINQQVKYLMDNEILEACICGWVDVIGPNYKAALFLVEKGKGEIEFTIEQLNNIFNNK